jgi:hypothetical protein
MCFSDVCRIREFTDKAGNTHEEMDPYERKDDVAVDRVYGEPLSGQFPLARNNTEKFRPLFGESPPDEFSIALDQPGCSSFARSGCLSEQGIVDQLSGNVHSLMS